MSSWRNVAAIAAGSRHTVSLTHDGNVLATGDNSYGQCDVRDWRNVVAVAAGSAHTLALCADGSFLAVGHNANGQCDVSGWRR